MKMNERLTIRQVANIAGVSIRTLHYYDQIGLLRPSETGKNSYRYYDRDDLLRLQQILFLKELSFSLGQIKAILDQPGFELLEMLETHRISLSREAERMKKLVTTIDNTIAALKGEKIMHEEDLFSGFSEEKQAEYQKYAEQNWDKKLVSQSVQRWNSLTEEGKKALLQDGSRITTSIVEAIPNGYDSPVVQALVAEWHQYINRFYDCSYEILLGLGKAYTEHPDFIAFYRKLHPAMPEFLYEAIKLYCAKHDNAG